MAYDRIFFFGDSITIADNDSRRLGWPGRLALALPQVNDGDVSCLNLGINGDTSVDIAARWQAESVARSRQAPGLFVFAYGFNDTAKASGGGPQVPLEQSVAVSREIMTAARAIAEVLWIGPTPLDESINPMESSGQSWDMRNDEIGTP